MDHFFNLSMDLFCIAGLDGYFKKLNPAWLNSSGYTMEELLATPILEFIHKDDQENTLKELERVPDGNTQHQFQNRFKFKDGSYRWLKWNLTLSEENKLIYAVARDITLELKANKLISDVNEELEKRVKKRTEELESLNNELESFSYSVSHDLRAPLRAVTGYSNYLLEDYGDQLDDEAKRLVHIIVDEAEHMGELIDNLLSFSRMGRKVKSANNINIKNLVSDVWNQLKQFDELDKYDFRVHSLPPAVADRSMIRQVFQNLISNAIKYQKPDDQVTRHVIEVGAKPGDGETIYYVNDNGVGFDMRYYDKLFGVFQRLHSDPRFNGNGIGLALVKRIITKHEGRVWAEGRVNKGATFYFSLPNNNHGTIE